MIRSLSHVYKSFCSCPFFIMVSGNQFTCTISNLVTAEFGFSCEKSIVLEGNLADSFAAIHILYHIFYQPKKWSTMDSERELTYLSEDFSDLVFIIELLESIDWLISQIITYNYCYGKCRQRCCFRQRTFTVNPYCKIF